MAYKTMKAGGGKQAGMTKIGKLTKPGSQTKAGPISTPFTNAVKTNFGGGRR